jgi:hypothetical protein
VRRHRCTTRHWPTCLRARTHAVWSVAFDAPNPPRLPQRTVRTTLHYATRDVSPCTIDTCIHHPPALKDALPESRDAAVRSVRDECADPSYTSMASTAIRYAVAAPLTPPHTALTLHMAPLGAPTREQGGSTAEPNSQRTGLIPMQAAAWMDIRSWGRHPN